MLRDGTIQRWRDAGADALVIDGSSMLFSPTEIAFEPNGDIYVYNSAPKVLVKFAPDGTVLDHWDLYVAPAGLAAAPGGGIVIADYGSFAVGRITGAGVATLIPPNPTPALRGFRPSGVAVAPDGTVYASTDGVNGGTRAPAIVSVDQEGLHQLR